MTPRKTPTRGDSGAAQSDFPGAVGINTGPKRPKDGTITDRQRLEAYRSRLEGALDDPETSPRDIAQLSRELRQLVETLAKLAPVDAVSRVDEIAARRRNRGSA